MLKARLPLADCEAAFDNLEKVEDRNGWRLYWITCVTLLRSVGHVLAKVDGATSDLHRKEIDSRWQAWKADKTQHRIFFDFIEQERNNILKEYEFAPEWSESPIFIYDNNEKVFVETLAGDSITVDFLTMPWPTDDDPDGIADGRDLIKEAIEWWQHEFQIIEGRIVAQHGGTMPPAPPGPGHDFKL